MGGSPYRVHPLTVEFVASTFAPVIIRLHRIKKHDNECWGREAR